MDTVKLPKGWVASNLGKVAKIERVTVQPDGIKTGTPYLGLEHITSEGRFAEAKSVDAGELASNKFAFNEKHLLYGKLRPYLKKIARPHFSGICSTDILPILPSSKIDRDFLYYYLRQPSYIELATARSTGANLPRLSPKDLAEFPIFIPSLEEQRRIADILDRADAIRRKRQEAIRLTEELLRSAFLEMFGDHMMRSDLHQLPSDWRRCTVNDLRVDARWACVGGPFGSNLTAKDYVPNPGVPVIRGSNLSVSKFLMSENDFAYVSDDKAKTLIQNMAYPGDVIFTQRGTLGQVGMIPKDSRFKRYIISQSQMKLTPNLELVDPFWLVAYFQSPTAQRMIEKQTLATGVPHINLGILRDFSVTLPPIEQQRKYSTFCDKHQRGQDVYKKSLSMTHDLFNSLLQRAFQGEL